MAQKLKKTALMFGQVGQEPAKPTLSQFYGNVGAGQVGAVEKVGEGVRTEASKLPETFGVKYDESGKPAYTTTPSDVTSAFKPSVAITTTTSPVAIRPEAEYKDSAAAAADVAAAQKSAETLGTEQAIAETKLGESAAEAQRKAGEISAELQKRLTEGKLGERRAPSELEKQAQDYRNVLTGTPGTSNVAAVANLMKFYDMGKYGALESGLRQGETSLARQQAGVTEAGMETAESARAGTVEGFRTGAEQGYKDVQNLINTEKNTQLENIRKFYGDKIDAAKKAGADAETIRAAKQEAEDKAADVNISTTFKEITNNPATNINNVLNAIGGRAGDNWLNTRGTEVLTPIKSKVDNLVDRANQINASAVIPREEKQSQLNLIKEQINELKGEAAGQLTAFLGDTNTRPGDALDAAEQIMAAGLIDSLSENQKNLIKDRIKKDLHIEMFNKNKLSSPDKLMNIYRAFGGTDNLIEPAMKKHLKTYYSRS